MIVFLLSLFGAFYKTDIEDEKKRLDELTMSTTRETFGIDYFAEYLYMLPTTLVVQFVGAPNVVRFSEDGASLLLQVDGQSVTGCLEKQRDKLNF